MYEYISKLEYLLIILAQNVNWWYMTVEMRKVFIDVSVHFILTVLPERRFYELLMLFESEILSFQCSES